MFHSLLRNPISSSRWRTTAGYLLLFVAVAVAYGNTLGNEFVWDDVHLIAGDARLQSVRYLPSIFSNDYFAFKNDVGKYGYYRPVATVSFMLDRALYGLTPFGFHLTNLLIHFVCCALIYLLGRKVFPTSTRVAWVAALFFAVHPVHTENVSWISGRTDLLATAFVLCSWLLADHARGTTHWRRLGWTVTACAVFALGLLAKEMALCFVALYYLWLRHEGLPRRHALSTTVPIAATAAAYFFWRLYVVSVQMNGVTRHSPGEFLATAAKTFWRYVGELVFPLPLVAHIQNPWVSLLSWQGIASLVGIIIAIGVGIAIRRNTTAFFLCLGFAAALIPVSNIVTLGAVATMGFPMAERFLYLPSIFFCWGLAWAIGGLLQREWIAHAMTILLSVASIGICINRNGDWKTSRTLFESTLQHAPDSFSVLGSLAFIDLAEHRYEDAESNFNRALDVHRKAMGGEDVRLITGLALTLLMADKPHAALNLAKVFESGASIPILSFVVAEAHRRIGQLDDAEVAFLRCVSHHPDFPNAYMGLARIATTRGDYAQALLLYEKTLGLAGQIPDVHVAIGDVHRMQGAANLALASYARALELDPHLASAHAATGVLLAKAGNVEGATVALEQALSLDPKLYSAEVTLAILLAQRGRLPEAEGRLRLVLQAQPNNKDALFNLAILFANTNRPQEARAILLELLKRMPGHRQAARLLMQLEQQGAPLGVPP